uniref:C2H2-type domain-containing protein n=1 Tax=Glossina brevipalpis TaxID=37001 RepID=A0A1A9X5Q2_9MUSC
MLKSLPTIKFNEAPKAKCGEIFCQSSRDFVIYCTLCEMKSFDFSDFVMHIENVHFDGKLLKLENSKLDYAQFLEFDVKDENNFAEQEVSVEEMSWDDMPDILNRGSSAESSKEDIEEVLTILKRTRGKPKESNNRKVRHSIKRDRDHAGISEDSKVTNSTRKIKCHQCECCNKRFVNPGLLKIHIARIHKTFINEKKNDSESEDVRVETSADDQMPESSESSETLEELTKTTHKYSKCIKITTSEGDESQNSDENYEPELENKSNNKKSYQCEDCDRNLSSAGSLKAHIARFHKTSNKKPKKELDIETPCIECDELFENQKLYDRHCIDVHDGFKCSMCDKRFKLRYQCKRHELIHKEAKQFVCSFEGCNKSFTEQYYLKRHQDIHQTERNFKCDFENCGKAFHTKRRLWAHQKIHTKPKNFICDICGYSCRERETLRVHQRTHTGERPYACKICKKCFISSSSLGEHMASHASSRTHVCKVCNARFARQKALYHHSFLHLDTKKFKCRICGSAYKQAAGLAGHMRKHREEDTIKVMPLESEKSLSTTGNNNLFAGFLS